jgi:tetratricopeptide (TPR) repeat protein
MVHRAGAWQLRVAPGAIDAGHQSATADESQPASSDAAADENENPSDPSAPLPQGSAPRTEAETAAPTQSSEPQTPEGLLQQAYKLSKTAAAADDFTKVIDVCRQAIDAGPQGKFQQYAMQLIGWAYNRRGEVLVDQGQNDQALADFEKSLEYDKTRWKAYHNRAVSRAMAGDDEQALADFNKTIELRPNYANAYFNRGELLYDQGRFQDAIEDYSRVIRLTPRDSEAYNSRGHAWYKLGNYDRALADYSRAIQIDPENAAAYVNRGDAWGDLGQFGRAASDYRNAMRIDPNLGRAYQSAAWLMATCPEPRYRNAEFALSSAKKAIELDGENYRYLDTLAAAQANAGDFESAKTTLAKAIESAPPETAESYKARMAKYEAGEAYRDELPQRRGVSTAQSQRGQRRRGG